MKWYLIFWMLQFGSTTDYMAVVHDGFKSEADCMKYAETQLPKGTEFHCHQDKK